MLLKLISLDFKVQIKTHTPVVIQVSCTCHHHQKTQQQMLTVYTSDSTLWICLAGPCLSGQVSRRLLKPSTKWTVEATENTLKSGQMMSLRKILLLLMPYTHSFRSLISRFLCMYLKVWPLNNQEVNKTWGCCGREFITWHKWFTNGWIVFTWSLPECICGAHPSLLISFGK